MKKLFILLAIAGLGFTSCGGNSDETGGPTGGGPDLAYEAVDAKCDYIIKAWIGQKYDAYRLVMAPQAIPGSGTEPLMEEHGDIIVITFCKSQTSETDYVLPIGSYKVSADDKFAANRVLGKLSYAGRSDEEPANLKSGTMKITKEGDVYTIVADVVTSTGQALKVSYSGKITAKQAPFSTLRAKNPMEPYEVILTGLPAEAVYAPDFVPTLPADMWEIFIQNGNNGTEGTQLRLFVPYGTSSKEKGFPEGRYKLTNSYNDGDMICTPGQIFVDATGAPRFAACWYLGKFEGDYRVNACAPATEEGYIEVSRNKENPAMYTISYKFRDDRIEYTEFFGTWTGVPKMYHVDDNITSMPAAAVALKLDKIMPATSSFSSMLR